MLCLKKLIIGFGIFLPVLLSALFVSPSYAISYSYTPHSGNNIPCAPLDWNMGSDVPTCEGVKYMIISSSITFDNSVAIYFNSLPFTNSIPLNLFQNGGVISFGSALPASQALRFSFQNFSGNYSDISFTLTDTLPTGSCPEPEDPEPCPVVPDTPYGDQLNNITLAIYTCGGILLVLYFFYCIYRIIIKNSGVSNL